MCLAADVLSAQQLTSRTRDYLVNTVKLTEDHLADLIEGKPVVTILKTGEREEVLVFGAVFIKSAPRDFVDLYRDLEALGGNEGYLAIGAISDPPQLSDLAEFTFPETDFEDLEHCELNDCDLQLSTAGIEAAQKVDWSSPNAKAEANRILRRGALELLERYQTGGNSELGVLMNRDYAVAVDKTFATLLARIRGLASSVPELREFLLHYPNADLQDYEDYFYWEKVNFGLKPTLRLNHVVVHNVNRGAGKTHIVVNKQLWASHYFQSAIDFWVAVEDQAGPMKQGFYLITYKASRQFALGKGLIGRIIRSQALPRARRGIESALAATKVILEKP